MVTYLEENLALSKIKFSAEDQRIWYNQAYYYCINDHTNTLFRCFPHIVNLAVQAILTKVTDMDYASDASQDYIPTRGEVDVVALLRAAIRAVRVILSLSKFSYQCLYN